MNAINEQWLRTYQLIKNYYKVYKTLDIPYFYEINGIKLRRWLTEQIRLYKKGALSIKQINLLELLGIDWDTKIQRWDEHYWLLEDYYKEHGNSDVSKSYCINGVNLGIWLNTQKHGNNSITDQQLTALNLLGIKWDTREEKWDENYYLLEAYYIEYGNINVPQSYEVNGVKLGRWLDTQRRAYRGKGKVKITDNQKALLNDLDIDWNPTDTRILNNDITEENVGKYNEVLDQRLLHILVDLVYEEMSQFSNCQSQQEIEKIVIKRLWR